MRILVVQIFMDYRKDEKFVISTGENSMFKYFFEKTTKQSNGKYSFTLLQKLGNDFTNGNYVLHPKQLALLRYVCSFLSQ